MPTSKSQDVSLAPTLAASATDPPTTPSGVETSSMTHGDMLEDQVSCLKKDMAKMKEDTDQGILLLKHDNVRMKVELGRTGKSSRPSRLWWKLSGSNSS